MSTAGLVIEGLVAAGTIAVAVVAIWGDWIRSRAAPPKLVVRPHTIRGDPTRLTSPGVTIPGGGLRVMYYHLKVVNAHPWLAVHNCRVLLKGISRRGPDGRFHPVPMAVPIPYVWAPAEAMPQQVTIAKEQVMDFGCLAEGADHFRPLLQTYPNNFQGYVRKGEAVRYYLEVDATNFTSPRPHVFEVAWDGQWFFEVEKMEQHLRVSEINEP